MRATNADKVMDSMNDALVELRPHMVLVGFLNCFILITTF